MLSVRLVILSVAAAVLAWLAKQRVAEISQNQAAYVPDSFAPRPVLRMRWSREVPAAQFVERVFMARRPLVLNETPADMWPARADPARRVRYLCSLARAGWV